MLSQEEFDDILKLRGYTQEEFGQVLALDGQQLDLIARESKWIDNIKTNNLVRSEESDPQQLGYLNIWSGFIRNAREKLEATLSVGFISQLSSIVDSALNSLVVKIGDLSLKTLVYELNVERNNNRLSGDTDEDRLNSFFQKLGDYNYRCELFEKYPVLVRDIDTVVNEHIAFIAELIQRLGDNQKAICEKFGINRFKIEDLQFNVGDTHDHGRTVVIISFESDKKIVYKPRKLTIHETFAKICLECEKNPDFLDLFIPKILNLGNFSFEEFVQVKECQTDIEVERYYTRFGQIIALVWFLRGGDMHFENIFSHGEYPVIIDYETVISNSVEMCWNNDSADTEVSLMLRASVIGTGLLPAKMPLTVQGNSIDFGALNGREQVVKTDIPTPVDIETDHAHYEYRSMVFETDKYALRQHGELVNPYIWSSSLIRGFHNAIKALEAISKQTLVKIIDNKMNTMRVIVRSTHAYMRFIDYMRHPSALHDFLDAEKILENLYVFPYENKKIFVSEYEQLSRGDVPMFTAEVNSLDMIDVDGNIISNVFEKTALEKILERKENIQVEASLQEKILRTTLGDDGTQEPAWSERIISNQGSFSQGFADFLLDNAIVKDSSNTVSWLTSTSEKSNQGRSVSVTIPDKDLYQGEAGAALLFLELGRHTKKKEYLDASRLIMHSAFHGVSANGASSAFSGNLANIYLALRMVHLPLTASEAREFLSKFIQYLPSIIDRLTESLIPQKKLDNSFSVDYLSGAAGVISVCIKLYEHQQDQEIIDLILPLAEKMMPFIDSVSSQSIKDNPDIFPNGAAHGLEGIALSFWQLYSVTGITKYSNYAHMLWQRVIDYSEKVGDFSSMLWCRGYIGSIWAQNELEKTAALQKESFFTKSDTRRLKDIKESLLSISEIKWIDDTVCHGRCGVIDTLISIYNRSNDEFYLELARKLSDEMIAEAHRAGVFKTEDSHDFPNLSFFLGTTGVAYTLLRVRIPSIPSILALEI